MASSSLTKYADIWITDMLGCVAMTLINHGTATLPAIVFKSGLPVPKVRRGLCALIEHQLVTFAPDSSGVRVEYTFCTGQFVLVIQSARWVLTVKKLYGELAESIVMCLSAFGQVTFRRLAEAVQTRFNHDAKSTYQCFGQLLQAHFIMQCEPLIAAGSNADTPTCCPVADTKPSDPYSLPPLEVLIKNDEKDSTSKSRKRPLPTDSAEATELYWTLNYAKFDMHARDQAVITLVQAVADQTSGDVVGLMLRLNELKQAASTPVSNSMAANDISRMAQASGDGLVLNKHMIEQKLAFVADDRHAIVRKSGESDFERAAETVCAQTIESIIKEKFDVKGLRVWRVLYTRGYLEQSQVEKLAMLPSNRAKNLLYQLLNAGFVSVHEVSKGSDFAAARTFYLFFVNFPDLVRRQRVLCFKILRNLLLRRQHLQAEFRHLVEREHKMCTIKENIKCDDGLDEESKQLQISEVDEQYMTSAEKESLTKYKKSLSVIAQFEASALHELSVFEQYFGYHYPR